MSKKEKAVSYHIEGYNCSQAVFGAFCEEQGLEKDIAMKIASGFGGGMRCGEVCGAVTGALMVLGLENGQAIGSDQETKKKMNTIAAEFQKHFKEKHGTNICKELLGYEIHTKEGMIQVQQKGLSRSLCDRLIEDAVEILEVMLKCY